MCLLSRMDGAIRKLNLSHSVSLVEVVPFNVTMVMKNSLPSGAILCVWCSEASPAGAPWSG